MRLYEQLGEGELLYKELYNRLPDVWQEPVRRWEELVKRYQKAGIWDIPMQPLSTMRAIFTEENTFSINKKEVRCFNNLRYCPPFIHTLEFIKIIYVWRGSITIYLKNRKVEMPAGQFCIITPGISHAVFSSRDEDVVLNLLMKVSSFSNAFSGILMEQNILSDFFWKILYTKHSNRMLLFRCTEDTKLNRWIEKIYDESQRGEDSSNLLLESYVMIFFGIVIREHVGELYPMEQLTEEVYVLPAIIRAMQENLKSVTLPELSGRFGIREEELKKYIVRESGYTYSYLLKDLRLRKAACLLCNTKLSMERIMEEVGYSNMTSFYHTFKKHFGRTPLEYRKNEEGILI